MLMSNAQCIRNKGLQGHWWNGTRKNLLKEKKLFCKFLQTQIVIHPVINLFFISGPSRPLPDMPQLQYDDSDALKLTWKPPVVDTKRPLRYQVQMQAPQSMDWRPLASGITDTSYRIRGLGPSRDYMFRVIPETSLGPLQPLPPVSLTALPGQDIII